VMSGYDCTTEAIVTKLMYLLGECDSLDAIKHQLSVSMCGEMTIS